MAGCFEAQADIGTGDDDGLVGEVVRGVGELELELGVKECWFGRGVGH